MIMKIFIVIVVGIIIDYLFHYIAVKRFNMISKRDMDELGERLKAANNLEVSSENGIYVFKELPEEIQKIIVEYIPPSFYTILGDNAYDFLNEMNTEQIRLFNEGIIIANRKVIQFKEFEKHMTALKVFIITCISFSFVIIDNIK